MKTSHLFGVNLLSGVKVALGGVKLWSILSDSWDFNVNLVGRPDPFSMVVGISSPLEDVFLFDGGCGIVIDL